MALCLPTDSPQVSLYSMCLRVMSSPGRCPRTFRGQSDSQCSLSSRNQSAVSRLVPSPSPHSCIGWISVHPTPPGAWLRFHDFLFRMQSLHHIVRMIHHAGSPVEVAVLK